MKWNGSHSNATLSRQACLMSTPMLIAAQEFGTGNWKRAGKSAKKEERTKGRKRGRVEESGRVDEAFLLADALEEAAVEHVLDQCQAPAHPIPAVSADRCPRHLRPCSNPDTLTRRHHFHDCSSPTPLHQPGDGKVCEQVGCGGGETKMKVGMRVERVGEIVHG